MALTINELIRERRKYVALLIKFLKPVDTNLEAIDRYLKRIISRRKKLPEALDLERVNQMSNKMLTSFDAFVREMEKGYVE